MPMLRVRVITPVYNDWVSFSKLLQELDRVAADPSLRLYVSAIDDGSTESAAGSLGPVLSLRHLVGVEIVHLKLNVGHQRAIAVGLCMAADDSDSDAVIVLDADGEDPPDAIPLLLAASNLEEAVSVVAQRRRRRESLAFRISYRAYKSFFLLLTGKTIDFGNFSLHSTKAVQRLTLLPDLWNNLAAAILRSKIPLLSVPVDRGRRYAGTSKMNYISLVVHGFGFISAYADTIFVRLLALSAGLVALTMLSSLVLLILRIFVPKLATPGWATTIVFGLAIITLQLMMTALSSILMLLNNRVQRLIRPRDEWPSYVDSREQLLCEQAQVLPVPPSYIER
jgi:glycosyltransferase involved in cell wall biosynthesis